MAMGARAKILYVEDDPANKHLVRKLLSAAGYDVLEASDGLSGITVAQSERPDLILMDMNMPGMDGYEASTRIKSCAGLDRTPIVALTANALPADRERSLVAGCDGYIPKPIDVDNFVATLGSYLGGHREWADASQEGVYLKEYNQKLVERLEGKVRELTALNAELEQRVEAKVGELEEAQSQLMQSEKLASIGQLAAGVAHEINNPVGYINSNISSLTQYVDDLFELLQAYEAFEANPSDTRASQHVADCKRRIEVDFLKTDIRELITESQEGVSRVKKIVQDLKDFSHIDSAEWQWVDLHRGLESTLNIVHNELKYKADVVTDFGPVPPVECIGSQLNQVFMNLLVNAAHAIEQRGTITVRTGCDGEDWVWIQVTDTGKGIEPDCLTRIFEPFFTTKPVGMGTGLGLALSYGIVKKHSGRIEVESQVGVGTCFTVRLPVRRAKQTSEDVD